MEVLRIFYQAQSRITMAILLLIHRIIMLKKFVEQTLHKVDIERKVCLFLEVLFLETQKRKQPFTKYPPKTIYISNSRLNCAKNGDFKTYNQSGIAYAWYV